MIDAMKWRRKSLTPYWECTALRKILLQNIFHSLFLRNRFRLCFFFLFYFYDSRSCCCYCCLHYQCIYTWFLLRFVLHKYTHIKAQYCICLCVFMSVRESPTVKLIFFFGKGDPKFDLFLIHNRKDLRFTYTAYKE